LEQQLTGVIGGGRLIVAIRAGHAEGNSGHDAIFRCLSDLQAAALQDVGKLYFGRRIGRDGHGLRLLRFVAFRRVLLSDGVSTGQQILEQQLTSIIGGSRLIVAVAGHAEGDSGHDAILRGLFNFQAAGRIDLHGEGHGQRIWRRAKHRVLRCAHHAEGVASGNQQLALQADIDRLIRSQSLRRIDKKVVAGLLDYNAGFCYTSRN